MKKISVLLLVSVILNITGFAQGYYPFINESKKWKFIQTICLTGPNSCIHNVETGFFKGDTLIDSYKYHIFYQKQEQPTSLNGRIAYYFREDTMSRQVHIYDPHFDKKALLYDFNLKKGDIFNTYIIDDLYLKKTVLNVDTFKINNKKLKRIVFNDSTTWIEGIGCITNAMIPSDGELICMKDNDSVVYKNIKYNNCDTIFDEESLIRIERQNSHRISVYPNPIEISSIIEIEENLDENLKIEIYDCVGILIKEDRFSLNYPIGKMNLTKGIYFCRVISPTRLIGVYKIIVK